MPSMRASSSVVLAVFASFIFLFKFHNALRSASDGRVNHSRSHVRRTDDDLNVRVKDVNLAIALNRKDVTAQFEVVADAGIVDVVANEVRDGL